MTNQTKIISIVLVIAILIFGYLSFARKVNSNSEVTTATNTNVQTEVRPGWVEFRDATNSVSFMYPQELGTNYIQTVDWPPQLQVLDQPYSCTSAGSVNARAGETKEQTIAGMRYCITTESEGAAGTIYTMYAYAFPVEAQTYVLAFSTRAPQCGNYDEDKANECQSEKDKFDINTIVTGMVQSMKKN
jgi:hypothetical protein